MSGHNRPGAVHWVVLTVLVLLYLAVQLSNAVVHLSPVQHPGNFHDEAQLTLELRRAPSLDAARESLRWGAPGVVWGYALHRGLGLETVGRRVLSALLATVNLAYLGSLLLRRRMLPPPAAILSLVIFAAGTVNAMYGPLGLTSLSLLLLYSTMLLHLLLARYGRRPSWPMVVVVGAVFALLALHAIYSVVALCAAVAALATGEALRVRSSSRAVAASLGRHAAMLAPVVAVAVLWALLSPHEEFSNPRRGFDLYFALSGSPQTLAGLLGFSAQRTFDLAFAALEPNPLILEAPRLVLAAVLAGIGLLAVGLVRSLTLPRRPRFGVALCFVLTLAGHLLLSVLTLVPYGNMRYLLPMAAFFPVLAVLGLTDLLALPRSLWLRRREPAAARRATAGRWGRGAASIASVALLAVPAIYLGKTVPWNLERTRAVRDGFDRFGSEASEVPTALVLDRWTANTAADLRPRLVETVDYTLEFDLRSRNRGQAPAELASAAGWSELLAEHDSLYLVTSMPFSARYYGELFEAAAEDFLVQPVTDQRSLAFAHLRRKTADMNLLTGPVDLAKHDWERLGATTTRLPGDVYQVSLVSAGSLMRQMGLAVIPDDRLVVSADLWSDRPAQVRLVVKRGDHGPYEGQVAMLPLGTQPRRFSVAHEFRRSWTSVMFGLVAPDQQGVTVFVRGLDVRLEPQAADAGVPGGVHEGATEAPAHVTAAGAS